MFGHVDQMIMLDFTIKWDDDTFVKQCCTASVMWEGMNIEIIFDDIHFHSHFLS